MTEFKIEPIQQVIIHDLIYEDIKNFLHHCYAHSVSSAIWIDGIIIQLVTSMAVTELFKRSIKGIKYYEQIIFVKYPKYTKSAKWKGGNYEVILRNYKHNPRFVALAKWIKSQSIWKTTPDREKKY